MVDEARVAAWLADDPDPACRSEIESLAESDPTQLGELFAGRIGFGTAGLRAAMGPGPRQMNQLVVRQTTLGLMRWLPEASTVVIGYDARHRSEVFARDVARMVVHAGGTAEMLPGTTPTPVLAHAVLQRGADAGVMITASHNPPADNGYKLYLSDGIQLVAPADADIARAIDEVAARRMPQIDEAALDEAVTVLDSDVVDAHLDASVAALVGADRDVKVVYTAMHGVGGEHLCRAFERAGFARPVVVPEQFDPDPDFPTAPFPNPEEAGALDLGLALAGDVGADVLMANDPDADRLAIAVPGRAGVGRRSGEFVALSGDQLGALLADHLLRASVGVEGERIVAMSIVSSRLMKAMARSVNAHCEVTLTGFKWVARPIVERPAATYVFGYEEAIGYCCGDRVRDKDGISAALVAAELIAELKAAGETVWDRLDALAAVHGAHLTGPVSIRFEGSDGNDRRTATMNRLLADPPPVLGGERLVSSENLADGETLPVSTGLVLFYDGDTRVIVRPSGTEPKLKAYVEVIEPSVDWGRAEQRLASIQRELTDLLG